MERDARSFLWDAHDHAEIIAGFVRGKTAADYDASVLLRSAVERQFEIIGEALNQFWKLAPQTASRIPEPPQIVAFRNRLIHGYRLIEHATVWRVAMEDLPQLRANIDTILAEPDLPQ